MTTTFVGRANEIAQLTSDLSQAREGHGRLVLVHGDPGIGKTRLADRLSMLAAEASFAVHWGRCWSGEDAPAFWPWIALLRSCATSVLDAADSTRIAWASTIVDEFLERSCSGQAHDARRDAGDSDRARFRLFHAVTAVLAARARVRPLLLVIDDLHDADAESLALLGFFAREIRRHPVLLVATCRDAGMHRSPASTSSFAALAREARRLPLQGLTRAEVDEVLDAAGEGRLDPRAREAVHEASDGNPFFIDELVRVVLARPGPRASETIPVPFTVKEALRERLLPFDDDERVVLEAAAAIGRGFPERLLVAAAGIPAGPCRAALERAAREGLVARSDDDDGASWRFEHALVRETLREDSDPARRRPLHQRIAVALECDRAGGRHVRAAAVAHHLLEARPLPATPDVVDALLRSARESAAMLAHEDASRHLELAIELLEDGDAEDTTAQVAALLLELGHARRAAGRLSRARATFLRAAALLRPLLANDPGGDAVASLLAEAALGFAAVSETGKVDTAMVALLEEALAASGPGDTALAARLLARLAMAHYFGGEPSRCARLGAEAVAMAARTGDARAHVEALVAQHFVLWKPGTACARLQVADALLQRCDPRREPELALEARLGRIADLVELGEPSLAQAESARYETDAEATRLPVARWHAALLRSAFAALQGDHERAASEADHALAIGVDAELPNARAFHLAQRFELARSAGRLAELEAPLRAAADAQPSMAVWTAGAAEAAEAAGHGHLARRDYAALSADAFAGVPRDGMWVSTLAVLARVAARLGDRDGAAGLHRLLLPHRDEWVVAAGAITVPGPVRLFLGILCGVLGERAAAVAHLEAAATEARTLGYRGLLRTCEAELGRLDAAAATAPATTATARAASEAPRAEFRRSAEFWTLSLGGESLRLKDSKGLRYIHFLLRHPDRELHVFDLVAAVDGAGEPSDRRADSGPMADSAALRDYRRRFRDLETELAEAELLHDEGRLEKLHAERDFLARELAAVTGLGGRARRSGSPSEQARVRVTKVIGLAMRRIAAASPAVGRALTHRIRTGTFCCYRPDPDRPLDWATGGD